MILKFYHVLIVLIHNSDYVPYFHIHYVNCIPIYRIWVENVNKDNINEKWLRSWNMILDFSLKCYKIIRYDHFHLFLYCHHHNRATERPYTILRFKIFFSDELWLTQVVCRYLHAYKWYQTNIYPPSLLIIRG